MLFSVAGLLFSLFLQQIMPICFFPSQSFHSVLTPRGHASWDLHPAWGMGSMRPAGPLPPGIGGLGLLLKLGNSKGSERDRPDQAPPRSPSPFQAQEPLWQG